LLAVHTPGHSRSTKVKAANQNLRLRRKTCNQFQLMTMDDSLPSIFRPNNRHEKCSDVMMLRVGKRQLPAVRIRLRKNPRPQTTDVNLCNGCRVIGTDYRCEEDKMSWRVRGRRWCHLIGLSSLFQKNSANLRPKKVSTKRKCIQKHRDFNEPSRLSNAESGCQTAD
jgi:hypothetical protein